MSGCRSINWDDVACDLEHAPNIFLRKASKVWRNKLRKRRSKQRCKSSESVRSDDEKQARWKTAYDSVTEKLLYSGELVDKGEHVRLLQPVKVVKRTKKQIHIVAAYTLYRCVMANNSATDLWSARRNGGLFGHFYSHWIAVPRYRLLRVSKDRLFDIEVLNAATGCGTGDDEAQRTLNWKRLCNLSLFANEIEYAQWHLTRYEDSEENPSTSSANTSDRHNSGPVDLCAILGLSKIPSPKEIKAAYRRMAMKHHPDRGGTADQFHQVQSAYVALCGNRCN